jgi:hypothetical protein
MASKKFFLAPLLVAILATSLLSLNPSIVTTVQAQMNDGYEYGYDDNNRYGYDDNNRYGYDDNNRYGYDDNNRYGYDDNNRYGYDDNNRYLDKDKEPQIFPANKVSALGDEWWQWGFALNLQTDPNPFTELGQAGCDVGLQNNGNLLFLVGTGKNFTTYPVNGFPIHECEIKKGTSILFPILNVACNNLEAPPFFGANETLQRICANNFIDETILNSLHLKIDGKEVQNPEQYRIDSPAGGFDFTAAPNNPFATPVGNGHGVSDGFWILLQHLNPGKHTIQFSGALDFTEFPPLSGIFEAGATYNLDVKPRYY